MNWELIIKITLIATAVLNGLSLLCYLLKRKWIALSLFIVAWVASVALFGLNYYLAKAPPFGNMYQVMSFLPVLLAPLYLYVAKVQKRGWLLGYFAATALIALIGALNMSIDSSWSRMPALQSAWFVPHVAAYILSYALATIGTLLTIASYFKKKHDARVYIEATYGMILLSYPFMTFGLWSGAIWADDVWGGYWSWDIKEVWSLITWTLYFLYFHIRRLPASQKYQRPLLLVAYVALIITFIVVNLLPKIPSMHSYAQ